MAPCDPACKKLIINTGFMAILAPALADLLTHGSAGHTAASKLSVAAHIHTKMLAAAGLTPSFDDFNGCDHAKLLIQWIDGKGEMVAISHVGQMQKWTADIWSAIADLAAGKLPTG